VYFWIKSLHIAAVSLWFVGLVFLPRLLLSWHRRSRDSRSDYGTFAINTLYFRIMTPAALLAVVLGAILLLQVAPSPWIIAKLGLVTLAVLLHVYYGMILYRFGHGEGRDSSTHYRHTRWLPLVLLLAIAAVTAGKPGDRTRSAVIPTAATPTAATSTAATSAVSISPVATAAAAGADAVGHWTVLRRQCA
jgi:putative membrane protein